MIVKYGCYIMTSIPIIFNILWIIRGDGGGGGDWEKKKKKEKGKNK